MHQAAARGLSIVEALGEELTLHHTRSPIFNPYVVNPAGTTGFEGLLQDPEANAHWIAYENKRAVGMNTFMQPFFLSPMTVPEDHLRLPRSRYAGRTPRRSRLGDPLAWDQWARDQGYQHVALHFATANVSGAKFWQSSGFKPVEYGMRRRVDERIAWANK